MSRVLKGCATGCGVVVLIGSIALIGGGLWLRNTFFSPPPATTPALGKRVVFRPVFGMADGQSFSAGTAWGARTQPNAAPILITALHLFGPDGGLRAKIPPKQLGSRVRGVLLVPFGGKKPTVVARQSLLKTGYTSDDREGIDVGGDVAAFKLPPRAALNALPLAAKNPGAGEWVWLVGDEVDHEPEQQRLWAARVWSATDKALTVKFDKPVRLQAFSGAPLVNARGEAVGILISGSGEAVAFANPVSSIRKRLAESGIK